MNAATSPGGTSDCLDEEQILQLYEGTLPEGVRGQRLAHLDTCDTCDPGEIVRACSCCNHRDPGELEPHLVAGIHLGSGARRTET